MVLKIYSLNDKITRNSRRWVCHVSRMDPIWFPAQALAVWIIGKTNPCKANEETILELTKNENHIVNNVNGECFSSTVLCIWKLKCVTENNPALRPEFETASHNYDTLPMLEHRICDDVTHIYNTLLFVNYCAHGYISKAAEQHYVVT